MHKSYLTGDTLKRIELFYLLYDEIMIRKMKPKNPNFLSLNESVAYNDKEAFMELINEGCDVNERDYTNNAALWCACEFGRYEMAKVLLEHNADIMARDSYGCTPLQRAVFHFKLVPDGKLIKLLVDAGADVNAENYYGVSPISLAHNIMGFPQEYIDILEKKI